MKKIYSVMMVFLVCLLPKETMGQQEQCSIAIRVRLQDKVDQPRFTITALEKPYLCSSYRSTSNDFHCSTKLPCEAKHAVLTVSAHGFKKYHRNLAQLKFENNRQCEQKKQMFVELKREFHEACDQNKETFIDTGVVTLIPSSPQAYIKQIIRSQGPDQSVRFDIILHNKLERELLVQQLTLEARRDRKNVSCFDSESATFQVANQLLITAKEGKLLKTSGEFQELLRSPDFAVQAEGAISYETCGGGATFSLEMPTAFTIPSKGYSAIEIRLPSHFDVKFVKGWSDSSDIASDSSDIAKVVANVLSYDNYVFHLQTSEEEEVDLVGTYNGKTRSFRRR